MWGGWRWWLGICASDEKYHVRVLWNALLQRLCLFGVVVVSVVGYASL